MNSNKSMIFSRLYGGMGNQMFQYAFCRKLQLKYGGEIYFDISNGTECATPTNDLKHISIWKDFTLSNETIYFVNDKCQFNKKAGIRIYCADTLDRIPRVIRKVTKNNELYRETVAYIQKKYNKFGFYTSYDCFVPIEYPSGITKFYVNGLFSSKAFFDDIRPLLQKEFVYKNELNKESKFYLERIMGSNSVCIHVRKGNSYISNPYLNVCTGEYFDTAMDRIEDLIPNATFYIFSNDYKWCKNNIALDAHKCIFVDANDSTHAVEELMLMKSCKHYVLSNSTMGWWAQYLNENQERIVISPSRWSKGSINLLADLIEKEWILIEV